MSAGCCSPLGPGSGGGAVLSVFGRTGAVVAVLGDYAGSEITNDSSVPGATVTDALNALAGGGVISVFGRSGVVVAVAGDYTVQQVTGAWQQQADVTARNGIPGGLRQVGQVVYTIATDQNWRLVGGTANANWTDVTVYPVDATHAGVVPSLGVDGTLLQATGGAAAWNSPLTWPMAFGAVKIQAQPLNTNNATASKLSLLGQNETGTGTTVGGALDVGSGTGATVGELRLLRGAGVVGDWIATGNDVLQLGLPPGSGIAGGTVWSSAATGNLRAPYNFFFTGRNRADSGDVQLLQWATNALNNNTLAIGDAGNAQTQILGSAAGGILIKAGTQNVLQAFNTQLEIYTNKVEFSALNAGWTIAEAVNVAPATAGHAATIRGQSNTATGAASDGGKLYLQAGRSVNSISRGVALQLNVDDTLANMFTMVEACTIPGTTRRATALAFRVELSTTQMPTNTGDVVIPVGDAATVPSADAVGGHIYYSDGGRPGWRILGSNLRINGFSASASAGGGAALPLTVLTFIDVQTPSGQGKVPVFGA